MPPRQKGTERGDAIKGPCFQRMQSYSVNTVHLLYIAYTVYYCSLMGNIAEA